MEPVHVRDHQMLDLDLADALPALHPAPGAGEARDVRILVRVHDHPVGVVVRTVGPDGLRPAELVRALWNEVPQARAHVEQDGLAVPATLDGSGLATGGLVPGCVTRRRVARSARLPMTVLIATRDRAESLRRCLDSVAALDHPDFEVVVVDNAPATDAAARVVADLGGRCGPAPIRYVREDRPGLARAHNRGLQVASGAWVAITDDDVVVDRHWLTAITEAAMSAPGVACVTGLIVAAELETPAQRLVEEAGGFSRGFVPALYDTGPHRPSDPLFPLTTGRLGSGANMAFDTAVLRALGGFDPAMGAGTRACGGDDLLAFLRVLVSGRTLAYQPSAVVAHYHRREYEGLQRQSYQYGVGLGAYLTAAVVHHPGLLPGMLRRALPGLRHFLDRSSAKNANKGSDFPVELERAERRGLLRGPLAYAESRWDHVVHRPGAAAAVTVPRQRDREQAEQRSVTGTGV